MQVLFALLPLRSYSFLCHIKMVSVESKGEHEIRNASIAPWFTNDLQNSQRSLISESPLLLSLLFFLSNEGGQGLGKWGLGKDSKSNGKAPPFLRLLACIFTGCSYGNQDGI